MQVLYEDNHIIIVSKAAGEIVQGDKTGDEPLTERVKAYIKERYAKPGAVFLGVTHRLDRPVSDFVFGYSQTRLFMEKVEELIEFLLPYYIEEGKLGLTIAIGCTGGRHRSVAIAAELNRFLNEKGIGAVSVHRDMER